MERNPDWNVFLNILMMSVRKNSNGRERGESAKEGLVSLRFVRFQREVNTLLFLIVDRRNDKAIINSHTSGDIGF